MGKWHNGPNGPSVCRATKGRCPYGGESGSDNHYESKEDAQKQFDESNEKEYGLIPNGNKQITRENESTKSTRSKSVVSIDASTGIPVSESEYVSNRMGFNKTEAKKYFREFVQEYDNPRILERELNEDPTITGDWMVVKDDGDKFLMERRDLNSIHKVTVRKAKSTSAPQNNPKFKSLVSNSHGIPMSSSNYISTGLGRQADEDEFNRKIARNINNPKKIVEDFNSDRNTLANFSVKVKDEKGFSLKIKDPFGNESTLRVNYED